MGRGRHRARYQQKPTADAPPVEPGSRPRLNRWCVCRGFLLITRPMAAAPHTGRSGSAESRLTNGSKSGLSDITTAPPLGDVVAPPKRRLEMERSLKIGRWGLQTPAPFISSSLL